MRMESYLRRRRWWEALLWLALMAVNWAVNVWVVLRDFDRSGIAIASWEPAVWEASSILLLLALLPVMLLFDRRFPLRRPHHWRHLLAHLAFTVPYSLAHVGGMVGLRKLAYGVAGRSYDFGQWPVELVYEYAKDLRGYATLLTIIYLYRFVLRRTQGEAEFLVQGKEEQEPQPVVDRFLVKKLGREFLVRVDDIDWIEASGNYVNLHVGERVYPLRETMTAIAGRLFEQAFLRVHRSAIVNLDRVAEIAPSPAGDGQIVLRDRQRVPLSRRYRAALRERLG